AIHKESVKLNFNGDKYDQLVSGIVYRRCAERAVDPQIALHKGCFCRAICGSTRSEEHTSELQSRENLVCRLLLEKKKRYLITAFVECSGAFNRLEKVEGIPAVVKV